jgi:uncharacterized protein YjiS (DUF1127 family)
MTSGTALVHLGPNNVHRPFSETLLAYLLRWEAWLDRRAGRRALQSMTDEGLADIGLSRSDLERF